MKYLCLIYENEQNWAQYTKDQGDSIMGEYGTFGERTFATADFVDGSYYTTIGLRPFRGRLIDAADVSVSATVAVISRSFAERAFGSADSALGRVIRVYDVPVSVIGVAPAAFRGIDYPGWFTIALPVTIAPAHVRQSIDRQKRAFGVVARLAPNVTRNQAESALDAVFQRCCLHGEAERLTTTAMTRGIGGGKDDAREEYAPLL